MTDEELALMRAQYQWATLENHMLVDGVVHLRCKRCGERPIPHDWSFVALCNPCLKAAVAEERSSG
jgi:formylmethanofuran dehydrogenase subunit E